MVDTQCGWLADMGVPEHCINTARRFAGAGLLVKSAFKFDAGVPEPAWLDDDGQPIDGCYLGIPNELYHKIPALSSTQLKLMIKKSPAHYWARYIDPEYELLKEEKKSASMTAGDLLHALLLESESVYERYYCGICPKDYPGALVTDAEIKAALKDLGLPATKANEKKEDRIQRLLEAKPDAVVLDEIARNLAAEHTGKTEINWIVWRKAHKSLAACEAHQTVKNFLKDGSGLAELSIITTCKTTGMKVRIRIDKLLLIPDIGFYQLDVKTTKSASSHKFSRDAGEYCYHIQDVFYRYVFQCFLGKPCGFGFLVVEWADAYFPELMSMTNEDTAKAKKQMFSGLELLQKCLSADDWPGYSLDRSPVDLNYPNYVFGEN